MVESAVNKINKLHFLPGTGSGVNVTLLLEVELLIIKLFSELDDLIGGCLQGKGGLGELVGIGL
jgi:hypothetical protein